MLDVVFLAVTVALFALVALVAKGVEKLGPPAGVLSSPTATPGQPPATGPRAARGAAPAPAREDGERS